MSHLVFVYAGLEIGGAFVVQSVVFESEARGLHPVDHVLVRADHLTFRPVFHCFTENIVCIEMDADHDVPVPPLRCDWECPCLVRVDSLRQFVRLYEDVAELCGGCWWMRCVLGSWFYFYLHCCRLGFGGSNPLPLPFHVSLLGFVGVGEMFCNEGGR